MRITNITNKEIEQNLRKLLKYTPLPWQEKVRRSKARFKVIAAGARSGKTYFCTFDTLDGVIADLCRTNRYVWVVAPNYDLTQRIWDKLMNLVQKEPFRDIVSRINNTKGWYRLETVFNTIIEAKSADEPEKLVGVGLTKIIVDEAGLVKSVAWRQSLRPRLIDFEGTAIFIGTPKAKNWFYDLYLRGQKGEKDWESWNFSSYENTYLNREELKKAKRDMPEYEYNQEILGIFGETTEQVFRNIERCIQGEVKGDPPYEIESPDPNSFYTIGIDLGRRSSYSVISVINEKNHRLAYFDRFRVVDWSLQKTRIKTAADKYPHRFIRVDATGMGGDALVEGLREYGLNIEPFIYTETTKKQSIDKLSIFIQEKRITFPLIPILKYELDKYGRERLESGKVRYKPIEKATDDCVSSLGLAVWDLEEEPLTEAIQQPIVPVRVSFR